MASRMKVYVETSVVSNLTARPSHNVTDAAMQAQTINWWSLAPRYFDLYGSELVIQEASRGDSDAAKRRLEAIGELTMLDIDEECLSLAKRLLTVAAVPKTSFVDAVHIATAAIRKMNYLVTWNCKHIANAITMPKIQRAIEDAGYECPIICIPPALEGGTEDV